MSDLETFRQETRSWLEANAPKSVIGLPAAELEGTWGGRKATYSNPDLKVWLDVMAELPPALVGFGLTMIGPTLLRFGNEEQKKEHLPKICRGEIRWCQGYSEPGSGSDLASLQTKAIRDGDEFVITGTKVWTSYADQADWIFALVRSDPNAPKKQEGITFILIDMDDPGVAVSPIRRWRRRCSDMNGR